ncbi:MULTISPECIES: hypothetical protein [Symbiopectobacterium]|uniref:hypothetical protein n=1 Tax=Symbiopectobacterium TaxID=801 RepID=UPI001A2456E7|nr:MULTISPECIES: hypothetical protein [Symbiopectobacterium]MBG6247136.1 hypothetical protein [Candidatus Symbiopectobacterium sp. PLON1]MBT9428198.1 hypothetical protein [Candidatus Symbiopectobacterium endolongispinus]
MSHLSWFEDENIASCNSRIDFINQVASKIEQEMPSRNSPITLISLGSAGLLTEFFIHEQLKKSGYEDINWRVIDTEYKNDGFKQSLHEFNKQVNSNCKSFRTEQEYLSASSGNIELAESDKCKGNVVVLSINPPTELSKFSDGYNDPECLLVKGTTVEKAGDANEICLTIAGNDYKNELNKIPVVLSEPGQMVRLDSVLKYSINKSGGCEVSHSKSAKGIFMYIGVKPFFG